MIVSTFEIDPHSNQYKNCNFRNLPIRIQFHLLFGNLSITQYTVSIYVFWWLTFKLTKLLLVFFKNYSPSKRVHDFIWNSWHIELHVYLIGCIARCNFLNSVSLIMSLLQVNIHEINCRLSNRHWIIFV